MKLLTKCPNCNHENRIRSFLIGDRLDLAKSRGKKFEACCDKCQHEWMVDVDDVMATTDLTVPVVGALSLLGSSILIYIFWNLGFIAFATLVLPLVAVASAQTGQRTKIRLFNDLYYDSKRLRRPD